MIIASIDIGTNTILLLIAKADTASGHIFPLLNMQRIPRLGKGLKPGGPILKEKIDLLFNILSEYKSIIEEHNCEEVILTATNAFRIASNSGDIVEQVKEKLGLNIEVVPGEKEAEISFMGASSEIDDSAKVLVIDIGGGSTELIYGERNNIIYNKSFHTGAVSGTEKFLLHDPPQINEIKNYEDELSKIFNDGPSSIKPDYCIAIAGTPTTLSCILLGLKEYNEEKIEGSRLSANDLSNMIEDLRKQTSAGIKLRYGKVVEGREDVLLAGSVILLYLMRLFGLNEVLVSTRGIRYGAVVRYLNNLKK